MPPTRPSRRRRPEPIACGLAALLLLVAAGHTGRAAAGGAVRGVVRCPGTAGCGAALVYVERIPGHAYPPGRAVMDQMRLTFVPHVLPVVTGTIVTFPNSDDVRHNVFSPSEAKRFNLGTYPKGVSKHVLFDRPGVVELLCDVHPEMSAYVVVIETPYVARVSDDGSYAINRVPPGSHTLVAWHERLGTARQPVAVRDGETAVVEFDLRR